VFTKISKLFSFILENACSYSPLTSNKINVAPIELKSFLVASFCIIEEIVHDLPLPVFPKIAE